MKLGYLAEVLRRIGMKPLCFFYGENFAYLLLLFTKGCVRLCVCGFCFVFPQIIILTIKYLYYYRWSCQDVMGKTLNNL